MGFGHLLVRILTPAMGNAMLLRRKKATHAGERSGVPSSCEGF